MLNFFSRKIDDVKSLSLKRNKKYNYFVVLFILNFLFFMANLYNLDPDPQYNVSSK